MADDVAITAGSGTTVATDDVDGRHFQRVKVVWGADGVANDANATTPLPVQTTQKLGAYGTFTSVLTTELNALANAATSTASSAFDNSTTRYPLFDIRLDLAEQGSARSAGATVAVYMICRTDGTNYDRASASTAELVAVFPLDAATTATKATRRGCSLPPENVEFFAVNSTGQAFAANSSIISIRPYYLAFT